MVMAVPEAIREKIVAQIPVGRLGRPDEIAAAVAYLVSDEAAFVTGSDLSINGGQYMH
jgi:acetoacetyl-CoA reductase